MGPKAFTTVSLDTKAWVLGFGIDFNWNCSVLWIGPISIETKIGFQWRLDKGQKLFEFYKAQ